MIDCSKCLIYQRRIDPDGKGVYLNKLQIDRHEDGGIQTVEDPKEFTGFKRMYVDIVWRGSKELVIYSDVWETDRSPDPQWFRWQNIVEKVQSWGLYIDIPAKWRVGND